jgi:hypothetical protein
VRLAHALGRLNEAVDPAVGEGTADDDR